MYGRSTFWLFWVSQIRLWLLSLHWLWGDLCVMLLLSRMTFLLWLLFLLISFFLSMTWGYRRLLLFMLWFLRSWMLGLNDFNFFQCRGLVHHGLVVLSRRLERLHRVLEGVGTQLRRCPGLRICWICCHLFRVCRLGWRRSWLACFLLMLFLPAIVVLFTTALLLYFLRIFLRRHPVHHC